MEAATHKFLAKAERLLLYLNDTNALQFNVPINSIVQRLHTIKVGFSVRTVISTNKEP